MIMKKLLTILLLCCVFTQTSAYEFNWKEYNIKVPSEIYYYERLVNTWNCEMQTYECKIAYANILLVTRWFKPLY